MAVRIDFGNFLSSQRVEKGQETRSYKHGGHAEKRASIRSATISTQRGAAKGKQEVQSSHTADWGPQKRPEEEKYRPALCSGYINWFVVSLKR